MAADNQPLLDFLKTLTVVYAEDNDDVRDQLSVFLQRRFARVITTGDGAEALQAVADSGPDLVITDIRMPIMDGLSLTRQLREDYGSLPVLVTTAHEETDYLLDAINAGVDQFILKPVDPQQLQRALLKTARQIRLEQALQEANQYLQENEARYRAIFWTAMDAFSVFDWDTLNVIEVNRRFQTLYGISAEEAVGENLSLFFDNHYGNALRSVIDDAAELNEPMIVRHINLEKQVFPVEMTIGQFRTNGSQLGLMAVRDARERLENMDEQETVIDALEMTIDALEGMLDH